MTGAGGGRGREGTARQLCGRGGAPGWGAQGQEEERVPGAARKLHSYGFAAHQGQDNALG